MATGGRAAGPATALPSLATRPLPRLLPPGPLPFSPHPRFASLSLGWAPAVVPVAAALGYPQQLLSGKVCRALKEGEGGRNGAKFLCVGPGWEGGLWVCLALVPLPGDGVPVTTVPVPNRLAVPVTLTGQQASTRVATLDQLRERLESGEPPEKKASRLSEEEQRLVQQAFQRNFFSMARQLPMKIRVTGRGECSLDPFRGPSHPIGLEWRSSRSQFTKPRSFSRGAEIASGSALFFSNKKKQYFLEEELENFRDSSRISPLYRPPSLQPFDLSK